MKRVLFALAVLLAASSVAQAAGCPRVDARQAHQHHRIVAGEHSGQLTARESHALRSQQRHIRAFERNARADGYLGPAERIRLEQMQDRASRSIYRQKHDRQTRR
ncbi:hypothetical protein [Tahibacter amnicola]|uniref:DUF4148 domain-containing protein n=1 Tax=Tahibacter amnicola TaxID=2976241 RepID=A0ABY6BIF5_9GAMM|nr:hypothetical protein [Tahibacter amnicola]UXI67647.1 hypothetical protein N4264_23375 [Tahibacter amnicola]